LRKRLLHKIDLVGTLAVLADEIEAVQQERNVRTFHALHERVSRVVRHNPVPFLFERLGSRYRHVFIDEFQDTSVTQWQNLIPLVDHVLAERNRTLVVGDGKQAIYR
jgi:ATP-dependent helicase/nuclease subunit A